jgi:hypothetical protein
VIRALLVIACAAAVAHAEVVTLPNTKATLDVPAAWQPAQVPRVVYGARGPAREVLAITRAQVPNPEAWRRKQRDAYVDEIERGVAARIPGYRRVKKKLATVHAIPTLDLEARRDGGATVLIRVLLYRTYALALAIEVPRQASTREARAIVASFAPPATTTSANAP